jgi:hypothetical protein
LPEVLGVFDRERVEAKDRAQQLGGVLAGVLKVEPEGGARVEKVPKGGLIRRVSSAVGSQQGCIHTRIFGDRLKVTGDK